MPYRRLPNTDVARLRSLKIAYVKGRDLPPFKLSYSQATFNKVQSFLPQFENALLVHRTAFNNQVIKSKDYINALRKAKLYISHFIQVVNMSILRGDLPINVRAFFNLEEFENKVPLLNTESDVIKWGELIIKGETERLHKGLAPITNPTIALVKVRFEDFLDTYNYQKTLQKNNTRTLLELSKLRCDADNLIGKVWDEVENTYRELPDELRRERAKEYGLVYIFRKNELKEDISLLENVLVANEA
jgi:hypothetical protein